MIRWVMVVVRTTVMQVAVACMVPESPVESRVNQKKTLTSDDPDNESVMEHKFSWQEALGPE